MAFVGLKIQVGTCMFTGLDEDGFPVAQADATGTDPGVAPSDLHHPFGFASRPRDPDVDEDGQLKKGCVLFYAVDGDGTHMWLGADPRYVAAMPQLKKGGSMQYSAPGSFSILDGEDGTQTTYVPTERDDEGTVTAAHAITVGLDGNGDALISHVHADGMATVMHERKWIAKNAAGDVYIELNDSGAVLNGNSRVNGGMVVGNIAAAQPVVLSPALATLLTAFATAVDAATAAAAAQGAPAPTLPIVQGLLAGLPSALLRST
jgi:hypothetical protein